MKKYEYKIVSNYQTNLSTVLNDTLNNLGEAGWKLCAGNISFTENGALPYQLNMAVFRRKIKQKKIRGNPQIF